MKVLALLLLLACIAFSFAAEYTTRTVEEDTDAVRNYWTEERMREAVDRDIIAQEDIAEPFDEPFADATPVDASEPVTESGRDSIFFPTAAFNNNNTESQHGKRYPFPYTSAYAPTYTSYPWRAVGKVFFTLGGNNFVCSAVVLRQNVVHTAGHCVFDPSIGFVTNFIFVPGYNNGAQPYGAWTAFQIQIPSDWQLYGSFCRDYAVVVIRKNSGAAVGDVVGFLGYMYNAPYAQTWRALGYPAASPFNGQLNYYADSNLGVQDTRCGGRCNAGGVCSPASIGIGSDATGGTSGGPWVVGWGSTNYLNGVNSYKYTSAQPRAIYGPYFDQAWFNFVNPSFSITPP